ncbi:MAG TPA: SDR family NAD(P)-dependent oxidoreductase, partial [Candidatus Marinimicrobia bacterium]|nr:SDR family NAD(P)-dependent oxidoreductase [Candidatus Neomarinimicrobiota bacterium]
MKTNLNDKTVVITGGSGILGRVMVSELFKAGANVAVLDLREPPTTSIPTSPGKSGNRILFTPTDVLKK